MQNFQYPASPPSAQVQAVRAFSLIYNIDLKILAAGGDKCPKHQGRDEDSFGGKTVSSTPSLLLQHNVNEMHNSVAWNGHNTLLTYADGCECSLRVPRPLAATLLWQLRQSEARKALA